MRRQFSRRPALFHLIALALCAMTAAVPGEARSRKPPDVLLLHNALPAVVNVTVWRAVPPPDGSVQTAGSAPEQRQRFFGSGFIIDPAGIVITNKHVIDAADEIRVGFADGTRTRASLIGTAGLVDIALLHVNVGHKLPVLQFGDSDALQIGDPVIAIGNPLGIGTSASSGIVSALNRDIGDTPYDDFIQTDAAINHGNSGGPLLSGDGKVVGINTALFSNVSDGGSIGLGFAITSQDAEFIVDRLLRYGNVRAGWIGADMQAINADLSRSFGLTQPQGSIISRVEPDSPALHAGLRPGDIILRFAGKSFPDQRALLRSIGRADLGATLPLVIWRDGREQTVPVRIAELPADAAQTVSKPTAGKDQRRVLPPDLGLHLAAMTDALRQQFGLDPAVQGVVVTAVDSETPASKHGLVRGQVIAQVQGMVVSTPDEVLRLFRAARPQGHVAVLMVEKGTFRWVALGFGKDGG